MANYNYLAPFYKILSRIVFGRSIERVNERVVGMVENKGSILLLGGGNGEILSYLERESGWNSILFCDFSEQMIHLAKKRSKDSRITFVHKNAFNLEDFDYDYIALPFFLDQFKEQNSIELLNKIRERSKPQTKLLFTDMNPKKLNSVLLRTMYLFFRMTTGLRQQSLPKFDEVFAKSKWEVEKEDLVDERFYCLVLQKS